MPPPPLQAKACSFPLSLGTNREGRPLPSPLSLFILISLYKQCQTCQQSSPRHLWARSSRTVTVTVTFSWGCRGLGQETGCGKWGQDTGTLKNLVAKPRFSFSVRSIQSRSIGALTGLPMTSSTRTPSPLDAPLKSSEHLLCRCQQCPPFSVGTTSRR